MEVQLQENVKLLRVSDNQVVDAVILELSGKHIADFETFWKPRLKSSREEDSHWDWVNKYLLTTTPNYERYALECAQIAQGLTILELDCSRSRLESGKSLVYLDYLSTAPWNRPSIQNPPSCKGVGTILFNFVISRSIDLEYKGRVGLHALPGAENFYIKQNMISFGRDPEKQNLAYFELSRDEASKILNKWLQN
jgi:hypothetical protein